MVNYSERAMAVMGRIITWENEQVETMMRHYYSSQGAPYGWETAAIVRWFSEHWETHRLGEYRDNARRYARQATEIFIRKSAEAAMQSASLGQETATDGAGLDVE